MFGYKNIGEFLLTGIVIVISLTVHEYSHGLISTAFGDDTPRRYGRLTLNPMAHIDILGLLCLFIFKFGWAKPVPINPDNYKNRKAGIIFTSLAGPLSNILLAFLSIIVYFAIGADASDGLIFFLEDMAIINVGLAVFNIIPLPPLDGSKIAAEIFGGPFARFVYRAGNYSTIILFLILFIPQVQNILFMAIGNTYGFLAMIAKNIVGLL